MGIGTIFWRGMWGRIRLISEFGEGGVGVGFRNGLILPCRCVEDNRRLSRYRSKVH